MSHVPDVEDVPANDAVEANLVLHDIAALNTAVQQRGWHVHIEELTRDRSGRRRFNALVWCRPDGARFGIHVRGRGYTEEAALATAFARMLRHQPS